MAVRSIRLYLEERDGRLRTAAKLLFTGGDASIYLIPYASTGTYFYGRRLLGSGQADDAFDFREQLQASSNPKLSIHETGQVHIQANDGVKAGPVTIPPLCALRGDHIATVQWDSTAAVPQLAKKANGTGSETVWCFGVPEDVEAGRLLIHANGQSAAFRIEQVHRVIQVQSSAGEPIFLRATAVASEPWTEHGISVLAGFDPTKTQGEEDDYLYLRGL
jgi:hypothetical protein